MLDAPAEQSPLPRLLFISDVPAEASYHGSALIYRLLESFPKKDLLVIEQSFAKSSPTRRLKDVRYETLPAITGRLLKTRFAKVVGSWLVIGASYKNRRIRKLLRGFEPQAVLTVCHGFGWLTASSFARKSKLPLHVIVHDDWPQIALLSRPFQKWMERRYKEVYRGAVTRLCVSPAMIAEYERRYGVSGTLLYPSRALSSPYFETSLDRRGLNSRPFTIAYAGSLTNQDYLRQLIAISWMLPRVGGRLLLFGPFDGTSLGVNGMNMEVVIYAGLVSSAELVSRLRQEADVLFVPESFETDRHTKISFPSKLTDYTAAAMPLLIWGPNDSPAVEWATRQPSVAAVVTDNNDRCMLETIEKLAADENWRQALGTAAGSAGKFHFSPERAETIFHQALRG
jgi:glycosyltransferase involved in cell wall biosynthesis